MYRGIIAPLALGCVVCPTDLSVAAPTTTHFWACEALNAFDFSTLLAVPDATSFFAPTTAQSDL
jgi:hypothetical protein